MECVADIKKLSSDLAKHVDVLIQHLENYHAVSEAVAQLAAQTGDRARLLTRQAIGNEIVSRLYRLIKNDRNASNYPSLVGLLTKDEIVQKMLPSFNHDGRKTLDELISLRDEATTLFEGVKTSLQFEKLVVYRARFVAHLAPQPDAMKKKAARAEANVVELAAEELRWQIDMLSVIADKVCYMIDRSSFPADGIADLAQDEARALWGLPPRSQRRSFKDVLSPPDQ